MKPQKQSSESRGLFRVEERDIFTAFLAIILFLTLIPLFTYIYFARDLDSKESIMNRNDTGVVLLDRNDQPFFSFYQGRNKQAVPLAEIPKHTQLAVIAMEDKDFYSHPGFSIKSMARALWNDIRAQDMAYGASTITQQLVKNSLLYPRKSFLRKYQEIVLAQEIERRYSKDEILEMYLNSVYFGEGRFGIEEASQAYFGKNASELDLAESALLAGILPAPSQYSPRNNLEQAKIRQAYVLERMVEQNYISEQEREVAEKKEFAFDRETEDINSTAPHFALLVRDQLIQKFGEEKVSRSGFRVKTSLDIDLQQYAESQVAQQVTNLKANRVTNGAAVVLEPKTGQVLAMVGSKDWFDESFGKVNVVTSLRQPGSSFKPIVYAAAFEKNLITPATILKDEPITYNIAGSPPYKPVDFDKKFRGKVLVRRALANSLNVPAVEVMVKLGIPAALEKAQDMGINTLRDASSYGPSLVLGAGEVKLLELTSAYGVFANHGLQVPPATIVEIRDKQGKVIFQDEPKPRRVLDPQIAFLISSILSDNNARKEVFGNTLNISRPAAVKTGTTENFRDALTLGYTEQVVVGAWVGNNDGEPMDNIAGSLGAAPIWKALMERYLKGKPVVAFTPPDGLVSLTVCRESGLLLKQATTSGVKEYFIKGTEPTKPCFLANATPSASPTGSPSEVANDDREENRRDQGGPDQIIIINQNSSTSEQSSNGRGNGRNKNKD